MKLIEKNHKDWSHISFLNVDYEIFKNFFLLDLKKVLPLLILSQQSVYVANRSIRKSGKLIPDLLDVTEKFEN